jgi:acetyl esterase/lipase
MPMDRHAKRLLEMIEAGRRGKAGELSAESLRRSMRRLAEATDARRVPIGHVEDCVVSTAGGAIPIRIYTSCDPVASPTPCIIYFHGGTGVFCGIETHEGLCRMLANASGCRVISVGYRLAPEHPFPAAIEDAVSVTRWTADHAGELQVDIDRLVVAGDSAGGTLAAVVSQLAAAGEAPAIMLQVLLCPVTDLSAETDSRRTFADGYFIERATLEWAKSVYCGGAELSDPRVSPLRAQSFDGIAPAHIHTAEFDPMRDEGEAYANALAGAGVPVRYSCHAGLIHHFYCMAGAIPEARNVVGLVGAGIRDEVSAA